jgi:hypothetical protein
MPHDNLDWSEALDDIRSAIRAAERLCASSEPPNAELRRLHRRLAALCSEGKAQISNQKHRYCKSMQEC